MVSKQACKQINGVKNILLINDARKTGYFYWKKINLDPYHTLYTSNASRGITDKNLKVKTIKLLEENI